MATQTTWTKQRYKEEITELYHQMKKHGFSKADCKRTIDALIKDENIKII